MIATLELLKNARSVRINSYKENFQPLNGFMGGSIEYDNHNGAIENVRSVRINSYIGIFLHVLHAL